MHCFWRSSAGDAVACAHIKSAKHATLYLFSSSYLLTRHTMPCSGQHGELVLSDIATYTPTYSYSVKQTLMHLHSPFIISRYYYQYYVEGGGEGGVEFPPQFMYSAVQLFMEDIVAYSQYPCAVVDCIICDKIQEKGEKLHNVMKVLSFSSVLIL